MPTNTTATEFASELGLTSHFNAAIPFVDRHLGEGRAGKVAIRTASQEVTYRELHDNVNRYGNTMLAMGITRRDRVLLVVKDSPEFFYLFWGAIKAGIVPVPINTLLRADDFRYMIGDSGCAAIFWSSEFAQEVRRALDMVHHRPRVAMPVLGDESFVSAVQTADDKLAAVLTSPQDECFWLYSSGSTGRPKGAVHLQRDMLVTSQYYGVETLGIREDDVFFSAAKLCFAYGFGNAMTFPLWVGGTSILLDAKPTPANTFAIISKFRPTLYFGVPTLYSAQLQAWQQGGADFSSVRACVSAGEGLPAEILRRWKEKTGTLILDGIGSTELLHIFISNRLDDCKPGSSGRLVKGYAARIVDDDGAEVPTGAFGRLHIKGASAAAYYRNNPEKTKSTMLGDWLDTGDCYSCDEQGYFYYGGRSDDMLKVGGMWSSPFEIESVLISHDCVVEVAVVGYADLNELSKLEAWIVPRDGCQPGAQLEQELVQLCKKSLAPYKFPRQFHFVDTLPKTATGKIQRYKLKAANTRPLA